MSQKIHHHACTIIKYKEKLHAIKLNNMNAWGIYSHIQIYAPTKILTDACNVQTHMYTYLCGHMQKNTHT